MKDEIDSLYGNDTWSVATLSEGKMGLQPKA